MGVFLRYGASLQPGACFELRPVQALVGAVDGFGAAHPVRSPMLNLNHSTSSLFTSQRSMVSFEHCSATMAAFTFPSFRFLSIFPGAEYL